MIDRATQDTDPLLIIVGPTGIGKTAVAIELCARLNGEIVSADSMQIYRGCDIGTAKPSRAEQAGARHHLIDICDPRQSYSATQWAADARAVIGEIRGRGRTPIIAGGTGFYINALLKPDLAAPAPPNPALRAQLAQDLERSGHEALHARLRTLDPDAAARLHPNDSFRVTRAIEVALWSAHQPPPPPAAAPVPFQAFRLEMARELLYERLNRRVEAMLHAGILDELRGLLAAGVPRDAPALRGVGYKEMLPALDDAARQVECVEAWQRETRRYAKRQMTWFRHQLPAIPINLEVTSPREAAEIIVDAL